MLQEYAQLYLVFNPFGQHQDVAQMETCVDDNRMWMRDYMARMEWIQDKAQYHIHSQTG